MAILSEQRVENGLSTIASFVQEIALKDVLGGQVVHMLTILELQSCVHCLDEAHCVARSTGALVSVRVGKIVALDVSEVMGFRNFLIGDVLGVAVLMLPLLSVCQCFLEVKVPFNPKFLLLLA